MVNVKFTKQILDTEMTVVRNEFERGENSPQSILRERVEATAYLWHNYGKSTIGSKDDLEKVPVERLEAFYSKYLPAGQCRARDHRPSRRSQDAALGGRNSRQEFPVPPASSTRPTRSSPPQDGERFVELRRVGQGQEVIVAYHGPSPPAIPMRRRFRCSPAS